MESEVTGNCHASFGERDRETHKSRGLKVRSVPTLFSPLLANVALDGIDHLLAGYHKVRIHQSSPKAKRQRTSKVKRGKYGFIRYADDFVVTAETKEDIEEIIPVLKDWLAQRGLELNKDKTNIVHVEQGFNFLGFNIRQFSGSCYTFPQKTKVLALLQRMRDWLKQNKDISQQAVIEYRNPILRGFGNYYRYGSSKRVFGYIDHKIWRMLWKWCLRRHPNKGKKWVMGKYFRTLYGRTWTFATDVTNRQGEKKVLILNKVADIPITRHVKVKGTSSPDDPLLSSYWKDRQTAYGKTYWTKGSKYYEMAENQQWRCPVCGEHLFNGEELQAHHKNKVSSGGTDKADNLVHLHKACHKQVHGKRTEKQQA